MSTSGILKNDTKKLCNNDFFNYLKLNNIEYHIIKNTDMIQINIKFMNYELQKNWLTENFNESSINRFYFEYLDSTFVIYYNDTF